MILTIVSPTDGGSTLRCRVLTEDSVFCNGTHTAFESFPPLRVLQAILLLRKFFVEERTILATWSFLPKPQPPSKHFPSSGSYRSRTMRKVGAEREYRNTERSSVMSALGSIACRTRSLTMCPHNQRLLRGPQQIRTDDMCIRSNAKSIGPA